jgi:hypothetical protein
VQQPGVRITRQFRKENPWPGQHTWPHQRQWAEEKAVADAKRREADAALEHIERTPGLLLSMCMFAAMSDEQQRLVRFLVDLAGFANPEMAKDAKLLMEQMGVTMDSAAAIGGRA